MSATVSSSGQRVLMWLYEQRERAGTPPEYSESSGVQYATAYSTFARLAHGDWVQLSGRTWHLTEHGAALAAALLRRPLRVYSAHPNPDVRIA